MDVTTTDFLAISALVNILGVLLAYGGAYHGGVSPQLGTGFLSLGALAVPHVAAAATTGVLAARFDLSTTEQHSANVVSSLAALINVLGGFSAILQATDSSSACAGGGTRCSGLQMVAAGVWLNWLIQLGFMYRGYVLVWQGVEPTAPTSRPATSTAAQPADRDSDAASASAAKAKEAEVVEEDMGEKEEV
jgi:hypothetical protein